MSEQIRIVAFIEAKPGQAAALEDAARTCVAATRKESGCVEYTLQRDRSQAECLVFVETWKSQEALDAHMATPHFKAFMEAVERAGNGKVAIHSLEILA
jgi:quinol monooxygenase YgiN